MNSKHLWKTLCFALVSQFAHAQAPAISALAAWPVNDTTATILWTTDQNATSQVNYGFTTAYGSAATASGPLGLYHVVPLAGLSPGTTYNFQAVSANAAGSVTKSLNLSFTTAGTASFGISGVTASGITSTSATVVWTTNQASTSQVSYGTTVGYGSQSALDNTLAISHSVTLTGLNPGTTYNYMALSTNSSGVAVASANFTFATTPGAGTPPPVISALATWPVNDTNATILWTTDQNATSQVNYGITAAYGSQATVSGPLRLYHVVPLAGLTPGTTYSFQAVSANAAGGTARSANSFTTAGTPPFRISGVTATGISATSATIVWTTDQASTSQVFFGTAVGYGSQSALNSALATSHSVTLTGLTPGTTYNYAALSANSAGAAQASPNFTFATPGGAAGPVITAVTSAGISSNSATVTWTTDQPSTTQVLFGATASYGSQSALDSALVTSHSATLSGLTPGTTYNFAAVSLNAAGLMSASANFTFTTVSLVASPVLTALAAWPVNATSATILWTTDVNATSQVNYGLTTAYGSVAAVSGLAVWHAVPLDGLTPGTTYNFQAVSTHSSGGTAKSVNSSFTTAGTAPFRISGVTASGISSSSATIVWITDQPSSTQVRYGTTTAYGSLSALDGTAVTSHSVTLTGLLPGTTYNYAAVSANSAGVTSTSGNFVFTTTLALPPGSRWLDHLTNDLLPFWDTPSAYGSPQGAFPGTRCNDTTLYNPASPCPEILNNFWVGPNQRTLVELSRQTYGYGVAFHLTGNPKYLRLMRSGVDFIRNNAIDRASGGFATTQDIATGAWSPAPQFRNSQEQAYGLVGLAMYYYLTRDADVLPDILMLKRFIFGTYYNSATGQMLWSQQTYSGTPYDQKRLVSELDQLGTYLILLAPILAPADSTDWKQTTVSLAHAMIQNYYSSADSLFFTSANAPSEVSLATAGTDFGHNAKTNWMIRWIGLMNGDSSLVTFAENNARQLYPRAYLSDGSWADSLNAGGSLNIDKSWWIFNELDQFAGTLALRDPSFAKYLPSAYAFWLKYFVDPAHGEVWNSVDGTSYAPRTSLPKQWQWKVSYHSFEHALVNYLVCQQLNGQPARLYYSFTAPPDPASIRPYFFYGNISQNNASTVDGVTVQAVDFTNVR